MNDLQKRIMERKIEQLRKNNCLIRESKVEKLDMEMIGKVLTVSGIVTDETRGIFNTSFYFAVGPRGALKKEIINHWVT